MVGADAAPGRFSHARARYTFARDPSCSRCGGERANAHDHQIVFPRPKRLTSWGGAAVGWRFGGPDGQALSVIARRWVQLGRED